MYSGYGIEFDGAGFWSYGNDFSSNVVIFGVYNSLSSHANNHKKKFLVPGKEPVGLVHQKISLVSILIK